MGAKMYQTLVSRLLLGWNDALIVNLLLDIEQKSAKDPPYILDPSTVE